MGLGTGVYFTSTTAGRNVGESFSPGSTELSLQPHQSAAAYLPTAECTAVSHPPTQPHLLGTNALRRARVNSHGSNGLNCESPLTCSTWPAIKGAHATNLGSRILLFPCRQHALVHLLTSIDATRISQDYCTPQYYYSTACLTCTQQ